MSSAPAQRSAVSDALESRSVFRIMVWGYVTLSPMAALYVTVSVPAHSSAVLRSYLFDNRTGRLSDFGVLVSFTIGGFSCDSTCRPSASARPLRSRS